MAANTMEVNLYSEYTKYHEREIYLKKKNQHNHVQHRNKREHVFAEV